MRDSALPKFIFWHTRGGQWATLSTPIACDHFDIGGHVYSIKPMTNECNNKPNRIWLSHWDQNHLSNLPKILRSLKPCWAMLPPEAPVSKFALHWLKKLPTCSVNSEDIHSINRGNDIIYIVKDKFILTGDHRLTINTWSQITNHKAPKNPSNNYQKWILLPQNGNRDYFNFRIMQTKGVIGVAQPPLKKRKKHTPNIINTMSWGHFKIQLNN
jgi:hypothetical protein